MKSVTLYSIIGVIGLVGVAVFFYALEPQEIPLDVNPLVIENQAEVVTSTPPVVEEIVAEEPVVVEKEPSKKIVSPEPAQPIPEKPVETPSTDSEDSVILLDVPFISQAPFREWKDPRQQDACEEASVMMVMAWYNDQKEITKEVGRDELLSISHYTEDHYGEFRDTSVNDTLEWIIRDYYTFTGEVQIVDDVTVEDIVSELKDGNPVIIPTNGQKMNNPYYTAPGPVIHMMVVIGYDPKTEEFITNDPGIGRGAGYRYPVSTVVSAIRDYETGYHNPTDPAEKRMIVVRK